MPYFITTLCVDKLDRTCVRECPVDCIYEGDRGMYINPDECIDCGACEPVCPQQAVVMDADMTEQWQRDTIARTGEWVAEHGATGGARRRGRIGVDHPFVAALPLPDA